jgi:hypothetical protein
MLLSTRFQSTKKVLRFHLLFKCALEIMNSLFERGKIQGDRIFTSPSDCGKFHEMFSHYAELIICIRNLRICENINLKLSWDL